MAVIRELDPDDIAAGEQLSAEAFGRAPNPAASAAPGARYLGAFIDGQLAAKVTIRSYDSHFHGTLVPTGGIGSVTVAAEHRGRGLIRDLMPAALELAAGDGAVVSGLFPTATGIYRGFGYESITDEYEAIVATSDLAATTGPAGPGTAELGGDRVRVRRASVDDAERVRCCYDQWGRQQNGPLSRRGVSFPANDAELFAGVSSIFLAEVDGEVVGYCSWRRGTGFGAGAELEVLDLIGQSAEATVALARTIGSFATVADRTRIRSSGPEPTGWFRRDGRTERIQTSSYQLGILDPATALGLLPPCPATADFTFSVRGRHGLPSVPGRYAVSAGADGVRAERTGAAPGDGDPSFTPGGLAVWWSGAAGVVELRSAGLLQGPTDHDAALEAMVPRRPVRILDHF